jgi:hypothetical protein
MTHLPQPTRKTYAEVGPKDVANTVWMTNVPCVGSTWLSLMLTELFSWHTMWPAAPHVWRRPQDVKYTPKIDKCEGNLFLQHTHTMYNSMTREFLKDLDPHVIILTRDLADTAVATRDHLISLDIGLPNGWVTDEFITAKPEAAMDHVIAYFMPWNINFYISWLHAKSQGYKIHFYDYEELVSDTVGVLARILNKVGESRSVQEIQAAIQFASNPAQSRLNRGVVGRGATELTVVQRTRLAVMLDSIADPLGPSVKHLLIKPNAKTILAKVSPDPVDGGRRIISKKDAKPRKRVSRIDH